MWREARRQEKLVRSRMVDNAKRHERRRSFYESIRREPEEFMQIHGRRATIHMDASVAAAAEASNILRKWQGDPDVLIDRFDARSHLDYIPEVSERRPTSTKQLLLDDAQELQCEYERYRILIFNEYLKVSERSCLHQIASKEFWPSMSANFGSANIHKVEMENKKKTAEKKAAIGYTYADSSRTDEESHQDYGASNSSTNGNGSAKSKENLDSDSDSSDDIEEEIEELDMKFDVDEVTPEQGAQLNKIGAHYRIGGGVFLKLLRLDYKEQDNNAQIKEIDKAKLALSGRQAKADRAVLKRRRAMIVGKVTQNEEATTTLLSFLVNAKKNAGEDILLSSSDSDDDGIEKTEFITSFGGDDDEDKVEAGPAPKRSIKFGVATGTNTSLEGNGNKMINSVDNADDDDGSTRVVQGPILPTKEYRRLLELKNRRSNSVEEFKDPFGSSRRRRSRSRSSSRFKSSKRAHSRYRSRSHSRERSSRRRHASSRSHSPVGSPKRGRHYRAERKSGTTRSRSRDRQRDDGGRRGEHKSVRRRSDSSSSAEGLPSNNRSPRKNDSSPASSGDEASGSDTPLTIRSSMSDSEREQLEIENRKRRIRRIKREMKSQNKGISRNGGNAKRRAEEAEHRKAALAKKLRHQMQKTLKKTAEQMKQEEEEKAREQFKERKQREEELLEEARILRMREREKLRQEDEEAAAQRERERLQRRAAEKEIAEKMASREEKRSDRDNRYDYTRISESRAAEKSSSRRSSTLSSRVYRSRWRSPS